MMREDFHIQPSSGYEKELSTCSCCPVIREPGGEKDLPFLNAADTVLSNYITDGDYLNITETITFPPVLKHLGVSQTGFEAEYNVFNKLRNSNLPMYVFHSWKPINSAEETADFLIVTKSMVISFEVKAFELVEQPAEENIKTFNKVLMKSLEQQAKVRQDLGNFLRNHGCGITDDSEVSLATFTLFPMAKDRGHHLSNISSDFETKLAANNRIDCVTASDFRERILFSDEYLKKLQEITKDGSESEQDEFQLRTLLSWFYGTYSYQGIRRPEKLELIDSYKLDKELNTAHLKISREVGGVFLTEAQIEVVKCGQDFLAIVGYPGTGKTFCLVAKILEVVKEKMMCSEDEAEDVLIVVIHPKESTLKSLKEIIWGALSRLYKDDEMQKVENFLQFHFLEQDTYKALKNGKKLKIFFDDYQNDFWHEYRIYELIKYGNLFWYTCYSVVPWSDWLPRPFTGLCIEDDLICEMNKYALLNKTVRFSAEIHKMVKVLTETMKNANNAHSISKFGPRMTGSLEYECGTRVVGDQVTFVGMDHDFRVLRDTLQKKADHEERFEEVKTLLTKTVLEEVSRLNHSFPLEDIWILDLGGWAGKALKQGLCEVGSELEVMHYTEIRGLEKQCIVMVNDLEISYDSAMLLDAVTRAISKVVILYPKDDSDFLEIVLKVKGTTPEISTSAIKRKNKPNTKSVMNTLKDYEQCRLYDLLVGEGLYQEKFWRFANTLHSVRSPCFQEAEARKGLTAYCSLSCAEESLKMIKVVSNSQMFQQFQTACHYALVLEEINHCCYNLHDEAVNEDETLQKIEHIEALYERIFDCLFALVSWMRKIEEEEVAPNAFASFLQYRRVFQRFRSYKKQQSWSRILDASERGEIYILMIEIEELYWKYRKVAETAGFSD